MRYFALIFLFLTTQFNFAGGDYRYYINLNKIVNDKVSVKLTPPEISSNEIEFSFPAMVPGTYEVYNFGHYISNFKVNGKNGAVINVTKKDINTWKISPANRSNFTQPDF